jgi:ubiquinone/menaquinone biosynthesis C-methylase UbiE
VNNAKSIDAARIRVEAYGLEDRVTFAVTPPGPLPFPDESFDLVVSVSVLEFVSRDRAKFVAELVRVVRPTGHIFISTPNAFRFREYHSRRWLGNIRRNEGFPWASTAREIRTMFFGCDEIDVARYELSRHLPVPLAATLRPAARLILPWQKVLFCKRPQL